MMMILIPIQELLPWTTRHAYEDIDGDGWGDSTAPRRGKAGSDCDDTRASLNQSDEDQDGQTSCDGDCDDNNPDVFDGAAFREEGCMFDGDGDGWGAPSAPEYGIAGNDCDDNDAGLNQTDRDGDGFTTCLGDCNDDRINVFPMQTELESAVLCIKTQIKMDLEITTLRRMKRVVIVMIRSMQCLRKMLMEMDLYLFWRL